MACGNNENGIYTDNYCQIIQCNAVSNIQSGINCRSNSQVLKNTCVNNGYNGIDNYAKGSRLEGNHLTKNTNLGIEVHGTINVIVKNYMYNNLGGNHNNPQNTNNIVGDYVSSTGLITDNPWANFDL